MGEGRERIPRKTLKFFGEARCAVLCLLCCCTLARLPCRCRTVPSTIDIHIDAGTDQSVIRATLLRYTLKSLPVNVLVCGKLVKDEEDSRPRCYLNSTPDKDFSSVFQAERSFYPENFHSPQVPFPHPHQFYSIDVRSGSRVEFLPSWPFPRHEQYRVESSN